MDMILRIIMVVLVTLALIFNLGTMRESAE